MEILTANVLKEMCKSNKKKFEGLLPELVKRLILASNTSATEHRFPSGDDIWAPGYDGVVNCEKKTEYVKAGKSVWEFGTNGDTLKKINSDYKKRTEKSLGVDKKKIGFYLVVTEIWAFRTKKADWEKAHNEWAFTKVYDAIELCEWVNSQPTVCAWLFETIYGEADSDFSTVKIAWDSFSKKTTPKFVKDMFTMGRQEQMDELYHKLDLEAGDVKIKANTLIDAIGFALTLLSSEDKYSDNCIVVNNRQTFKRIASIVSDKFILLTYAHDGEVYNKQNRIIMCFNKEATSVKDAIELPLLTRSLYEDALRKMGIPENKIRELFDFTHGNLRALIRRIPGNIVEIKPEWAQKTNIEALAPLVLMRSIDREKDRKIVERLANEDFDKIEKIYKSLSMLEDAPLKRVENDHYVIINYEEAWDVLALSSDVQQFECLINLLGDMFDSINKTGRFEGRTLNEYKIIISNLLDNLISYSYGDDKRNLNKAVDRILKYSYELCLADTIISSWSILAVASPECVMNFISEDYTNKFGIINTIFNGKDIYNQYELVLSALDKLAIYQETLPEVCRILFELLFIDRKYSYRSSPEESLQNALFLKRCEGTVTLSQKESIIMMLLNKNPEKAIEVFAKLIRKNTYYKRTRIIEKQIQAEKISAKDLISSEQRILDALFDKGLSLGKVSEIKSLLENYTFMSPNTFSNYAERFNLHQYSEDEITEINFYLRKQVFDIQYFRNKKYQKYVDSLKKWVSVTEYKDDIRAARWIFKEVYCCPADELLSDKNDNTIFAFRKNTLNRLLQHDKEACITMFVNSISDDSYWGVLLAKLNNAEIFDSICCRLNQEHKFRVLASLLDSSEAKKVKDFLYSPSISKAEIVPQMRNKNLVSCLESDDVDLFWKDRSMTEYADDIYKALLNHNPKGLIDYLYIESDKNSEQFIDMSEEIFNALVDKDCDIKKYEHEICCIVSKIDRVHYSDEWAKLCMKLWDNMESDFYPECVCKYVFLHPEIVGEIIRDRGIGLYRFEERFRLPECAFKEYRDFKNFFDAIIKSETDYNDSWFVIGAIMGKKSIGTDGLFPHEFIRMALEDYNSKDLDEIVATSFEEICEVRFVLDGNDQMTKANEYKNSSNRLKTCFPHAAKVLNIISTIYLENARRDKIDSEVML